MVVDGMNRGLSGFLTKSSCHPRITHVDKSALKSVLNDTFSFIIFYILREPHGSWNRGSPISMWRSNPSSGCREQHTTRTAIVLAFWQIFDNGILIMLGAS
jgi:hypothetical protein